VKSNCPKGLGIDDSLIHCSSSIPFGGCIPHVQGFSWSGGIPWTPVIGEVAVNAFVSNKVVLETFGVDKETLSRRLFSTPWTPEAALNDCEYHIRFMYGPVDRLSSFEPTKRGDGVPPLPRISPALM